MVGRYWKYCEWRGELGGPVCDAPSQYVVEAFYGTPLAFVCDLHRDVYAAVIPGKHHVIPLTEWLARHEPQDHGHAAS